MFRKDAKADFAALPAGWVGSNSGQWTEAQVGALFNFKIILEDRSSRPKLSPPTSPGCKAGLALLTEDRDSTYKHR
jgi:hypothetical protein